MQNAGKDAGLFDLVYTKDGEPVESCVNEIAIEWSLAFARLEERDDLENQKRLMGRVSQFRYPEREEMMW